MYKSILVVVDESKSSTLALKEAIKITKYAKAKLVIAHVVDLSFSILPVAGVDIDKYEAIRRTEGMLLLKKMESIARSEKIKAKTILIENISTNKRISDNILEAAASLKPDLLILGTHGRRGFHRFMLGSVAEAVIRMANVPVLLIREKVKRSR